MSISPDILAAQTEYAARPFAVRWRDSHCAVTCRFNTFAAAFDYAQDQWARITASVAAHRYMASDLWQSEIETPAGTIPLAYYMLAVDVSSY